MGVHVEVSWRLIKVICCSSASLAQFIGALCKFIRPQLGKEHMQRLLEDGDANAFICEPKATKEMYDAVHVMHLMTLSACWILATCTSKRNAEIRFRDMMEVVMKSGHRRAPLNLKVSYHRNRVCAGEALLLELLDLKTVLMRR